tara:strand:- start:152 stop:418 length:267 start_codon:yes stop_codon:yes gene_type:complete
MNHENLKKLIKAELQEHGRNFDYGHHKSDAKEGKMMKKSLLVMAKDLVELHNYLEDQDDLPSWCHSYISVARDRLGVVKDYLTTKEGR